MADYRIRILVEGEDRASSPLGNINNALGKMGQIAGGIISAQAIMGVARGILSIGTNAINATAQLQSMEMGLASLAAREIAAAANAEAMAAASAKGIDLTTVATMKISDALPQAEEKAKALIEELSNIAIVSPYQLQTVQGSYQMAAAFGYSSDEAMKFTKALLNVGAGVGADNERLNRMAYNLAQIRMVGKVTALDLRQLSMAGFDLNSVLAYMGKEIGVQINNHEDFNKALEQGKVTWEQFSDSFMRYSEENFGGAAERMARTWNGLKSTMSDVFVLTFPKILGPALETFTGFANGILDAFLKIRESPVLDQMADGINRAVTNATEKLQPFVDNFSNLIEAIADAGVASSEFREAMGLMIGDDNLEKTSAFLGGLKSIVDFVSPFVSQVASFLSANVKFSDFLVVIGGIIASVVVPALISFVAAIAPFFALVGMVALLRTAWETNWLGIRDALINAWTTTILPALQQLWAWLQVNIPIALQTLSAYWTGTLQPALMQVWAWIQANVLPLLSQLWAWLQVNIPIALQTLSVFWTTTLLPAIQAVGAWITGTLIPTLLNVWNWLATNIPAAISTLSGFWTGTLLPAITAVYDWMANVAFPFWQALADFLSAILGKAVEALAGLWQNILLPGLTVVGDYISAKLQPTLDAISEFISGTLQPVSQTFSDFLSGALLGAFEGIRDVIQDVTGWLSSMAEKISQLKLPDWLTPGSPTPFEIGLRGIADALSEVNGLLLPTLSVATTAAGGSARANWLAGGGATIGGDSFVINNYNEKAAALNMAWISSQRSARLNSRMGR